MYLAVEKINYHFTQYYFKTFNLNRKKKGMSKYISFACQPTLFNPKKINDNDLLLVFEIQCTVSLMALSRSVGVTTDHSKYLYMCAVRYPSSHRTILF